MRDGGQCARIWPYFPYGLLHIDKHQCVMKGGGHMKQDPSRSEKIALQLREI